MKIKSKLIGLISFLVALTSHARTDQQGLSEQSSLANGKSDFQQGGVDAANGGDQVIDLLKDANFIKFRSESSGISPDIYQIESAGSWTEGSRN